jgi:hypothetical protein
MLRVCDMRKIALFLILLFLFSCSFSPSESIGKKVILSETHCQDCMNIIKFKKTNGIRDGIHYQMYFDAEIIFLKDSKSDRILGIESQFRNMMPREEGKTYSFDKFHSKGEKYKLSGIIYFIKTEKGWLPTSEPLKLDEFKKI